MNKKDKINISKDQKIKCNAIIHGASVSAGAAGTGLAQIPLADSAIITPIQIGMIVALGKVFDQEISKSAAKAILTGMAAAFAGRGISQVLVGWIPGVGNAVNAATAATITEAVGWMAVDNFSKDAYKDIIAQNPMTDDEREENAKEEDEKKEQDKDKPLSILEQDEELPLSEKKQDEEKPLSEKKQDEEKPLSKKKQDEEKPLSEKQDEEKPLSKREELIYRANQFIKGEKDNKSNKDEYNRLLSEFDSFLLDTDNADPIYEIYNALSDLR